MQNLFFQKLLHKEAKISKLNTKEDKLKIHKTLGILSILSFIYRYGIYYPIHGTLGFDGKPFDYITMAVHLVLAFSSILFRVPRHRLENKPMIIYEEYRLHAMVFTLRSAMVFMMGQFNLTMILPLVILLHHILVDLITMRHGTPGNTAVRSTAGAVEKSFFKSSISKLYSFYQFLALGSNLIPNDRLGDLGFNAIIAIQSSAFMMTLYRKRIIRGTTHLIVYSSCLILSGFHIIRLLRYESLIGIIVVFLSRINLPKPLNNKYLLWTIYVYTHM